MVQSKWGSRSEIDFFFTFVGISSASTKVYIFSNCFSKFLKLSFVQNNIQKNFRQSCRVPGSSVKQAEREIDLLPSILKVTFSATSGRVFVSPLSSRFYMLG